MANDEPDFDALARKYLDLWQGQVTAAAADPRLSGAIAKGIATMSSGMAAMMAGVQTATKRSDADDQSPSPPPASARAQAAAAAPDDSRLDPTLLAVRVAALEQRVRALESQLAAAKPVRAKRPTKRPAVESEA